VGGKMQKGVKNRRNMQKIRKEERNIQGKNGSLKHT
jgi:hypothetical protein